MNVARQNHRVRRHRQRGESSQLHVQIAEDVQTHRQHKIHLRAEMTTSALRLAATPSKANCILFNYNILYFHAESV